MTTPAVETKLLCGYKEIRAYLVRQYSYAPSRQVFWRMRRREKDPFPGTEKVVDHKQRIFVPIARVDAWVRRNLLGKNTA